MAEVWRAHHDAERVSVAVKVLTGAHARDDAFVRALTNEIHAVARLDHPGIIVLYDRGTVSDDAAAASEGRLVAGSPWLAMEMCSDGALSARRFPLPWSASRTLLLSLLDALAHAHARGVIHRDLKPGNILLCGSGDARPGLKLSDFGIAQPLGIVDDDAGAGRAHAWSGTPRSMAPEQFNGLARELGPWTDLYALGCLAFQIARGQPPFAGDAGHLAIAHCHTTVPPIGDVDGYPAGYEAWVLRLLEKQPRDRFRTAADAAWGLLQLSPDDEDTQPSDWQMALRSLRPRSVLDGDVAASSPSLRSSGALVSSADAHGDDTWARTIGPPVVELAVEEAVAATDDEPGRDDTTGPMRSAILPLPPTGVSTSLTQQPTALLRVQLVPPPIDDAGARVAIADDDPFAAVLGVHGDVVGDDRPATDPRSFAPQAPWTELLALANRARPRQVDDDWPTIGGPLAPSSMTTTTLGLDGDERRRAVAVAPPVPASWRRPHEVDDQRLPPQRVRLPGAGLGLWGLRRVPFIDRHAERDLLWQALTSMTATKKPCVVVVHGAAGLGRSRLLSWYAERAAEVGAATAFRTGGADGLGGALARALRLPAAYLASSSAAASGEATETLHRWLRGALAELDDVEIAVLARFLSSERGGRNDDDDDDGRSRDRAIARALVALSPARVPLVVIDDAHLDDEAIAFARRLIDSPDSAPILVVLAVADEALAERPTTAAAVTALGASVDVNTIVLQPLSPRDHRRLVGELLGLEPHLADAVSARSAGNPRFAVAVVGDFVERDALELGPSGFALRRGETPVLPDTLHAVWSARLLRLLSTLPAEARRCLELGAVLGDVGDDVWIATCEGAGVVGAADLVALVSDALEQARLVVTDQPGALRFSHSMLRESMIRLAADSGRLVGHHRLIAASLADAAALRDIERRADHLLAAGDVDVALPVVLRLATMTLQTAGPGLAGRQVDRLFAALDRLSAADRDPRRRRAVALRARVLAEAGRIAESAMWSSLIGDDDVLATRVDALRASATCATHRGDDASAAFSMLLVLVDDDDDDDGAAVIDEALIGLADAHRLAGRLDDAATLLGRALLRGQRRDDSAISALCLCRLATVALWRGDPGAARALVLRAQKIARAAGLRPLAAISRSVLGDIERVAGVPHEARSHYEEAARALTAVGSGLARAVEVNLVLCDVAEGRIADSSERAATLLSLVESDGVAVALCHGVLALGAAQEADWSAADAHLVAFLQPWSRGVVDGEHALLAEACAQLANAANEPWRAGVASGCARDVWLALGRADRLDAFPGATSSSSSSTGSSR